jgi:hypothetical protein
MNYKILFQTFLFLCFVLIIYLTLYFYRSDPLNQTISQNELPKASENITNTTPKVSNDGQENILHNISYKNFDKEGNAYTINAFESVIANDNPNIVNMKKVNAEIIFKNYEPIIITSDKAVFDKINFETEFADNIQLNYLDHQINSQKLNLLFNKNLLKISEQVIYKNSTSNLAADAIVVDLITKDSKIFSNNNSKKIKILSKN